MGNPRVRKAKAAVAEDAKSAIAAELQRIEREHGGLKPSIVVAIAEAKESPLHNSFEWDNKKAGHQYRLMQARALIRVTVTMITVNGESVKDRYIHVPPTSAEAKNAESDEGVYLPMSVVVRSPDAFARALSELAAKVRSAQAAAEELRSAAATVDNPDGERMARIAMAITALQTAGAAVSALH